MGGHSLQCTIQEKSGFWTGRSKWGFQRAKSSPISEPKVGLQLPNPYPCILATPSLRTTSLNSSFDHSSTTSSPLLNSSSPHFATQSSPNGVHLLRFHVRRLDNKEPQPPLSPPRPSILRYASPHLGCIHTSSRPHVLAHEWIWCFVRLLILSLSPGRSMT